MKKKILAIDDDKKILNLINTLLSRAGYAVSLAGNGAEAIAKAAQEKPDLLLVDLMLPDMDGAEVVRILKDDQGCTAPIIFLTAMITKSEESKSHLTISVKERDYPAIAKPFREAEFLAAIQKACGGGG